MAEEVQYSSGTDLATNKRKYEDQTPRPSDAARRPTGFSAPMASQSPDSGTVPLASYNSVQLPLDEVQLAKQRAQEIAARIFNTAEAKRLRVENNRGGGFDSYDFKSFSSGPTDAGQNSMFSNMSPLSIPVSHGFQGTSKKIDILSGRVGAIIGKGGETIKYLQLQSGAKIQVTRDADADPYSATRPVELMGMPDQIAKAEQLIQDVLAEAGSGGSGLVSRMVTPGQSGSDRFVMQITNNKVGLVIGKGGETIKSMQARTGARIQVIPLHLPPGDTSTERTLQIDGTSEQIEAAKELVSEVTRENRPRNQSMSGGYSQQVHQARTPTSWVQPGPTMQQPGYGYIQSGSYSQTPHYSQPQYPGYPQPTTGYSTSWDQTTGAPTQQQTSQGGAGGYDYYNTQQSQPLPPDGSSALSDNISYGYSQPLASGYYTQGLGYPQEGYGGHPQPGYGGHPQPGYGQPPPNYDQQQGYTSTPGNGNLGTTTTEGHGTSYGGAQGDGTQAPPPIQPSPARYQPQGTTQPGYGVPASQTAYGTQPPSGYGPTYAQSQAQKHVANQLVYGQPQQSPTAQGSYVQPGYAHSQPPPAQVGYAQPDSGAQRAPPSGYGTAAAQAGYGAPPYGAPPPATQQGYVQQQPPYNSSYVSVPTSQVVQTSGVAKASPKS